MRITKVGVVGSSTKCLLTQLKRTALVSDVISIGRTDYNSRSGATPLSLHHSSQKVNSTVKSKIRKDKRKVKDVITGTRTHTNPGLAASKSKALPTVRIPTPPQGAPRDWRSSFRISVPDIDIDIDIERLGFYFREEVS